MPLWYTFLPRSPILAALGSPASRMGRQAVAGYAGGQSRSRGDAGTGKGRPLDDHKGGVVMDDAMLVVDDGVR